MYNFVVQLFDPYTLLVLGLAIATGRACWRQRPRSRWLVAATALVGLLVVCSTPYAGFLALGSLEWPYPAIADTPARTDTIVVLSGGVIVDDEEGKQARLDCSSLQRCYYAAQLYHKAGRCRMVLTGGKIDWTVPGPTYAAAMRDSVLALGVRPEDVVLEEKASSTYENARYTKPLLQNAGKTRIWLVTEASHMNRSERCFRALGIDVTPAPCDHHAWRHRYSVNSFLPSSGGISQVCRAAHEWRGRLWYRLRGRI
jgi:uncharacterized SAM-binding protein YcdF (DUF218 family)